MRSAAKGALLSGLVCPGLGQIVQKHYFRGIALIGAVSVSLLTALRAAVEGAEGILAELRATGGQDPISTILSEAGKLSSGRALGALGTSSLLMLACWVIGILDAYLSGRKIDADNGPHDQATQPAVRLPR